VPTWRQNRHKPLLWSGIRLTSKPARSNPAAKFNIFATICQSKRCPANPDLQSQTTAQRQVCLPFHLFILVLTFEFSSSTTTTTTNTETPTSSNALSTPALARRLISSSLLNSPARTLFSPTTPANQPHPTNLLSRFGAPTSAQISELVNCLLFYSPNANRPSPFHGTKSRVAKDGIVPQPFVLPVTTPNPTRQTSIATAMSSDAQTPQAMPPPVRNQLKLSNAYRAA